MKYYIYAPIKIKGQPIEATLVEEHTFDTMTSLSEYLQLPPGIVMKHVDKTEVALMGYLIKTSSVPKFTLTEMPFEGERIWPYNMQGVFIGDTHRLAHGYNLRDAARALGTCANMMRRGTNLEFREGATPELGAKTLETNTDAFLWRSRHAIKMPSTVK